MASFIPVYIYAGLVILVALLIATLSSLFPAKRNSKTKYLPYESGIKTETHLFQQRITLRHYLVGLLFLVFDIEVIFLYPWAVVSKKIGPFAFYEMAVFLIAILIGFAYVWKKGGLEWE